MNTMSRYRCAIAVFALRANADDIATF